MRPVQSGGTRTVSETIWRSASYMLSRSALSRAEWRSACLVESAIAGCRWSRERAGTCPGRQQHQHSVTDRSDLGLHSSPTVAPSSPSWSTVGVCECSVVCSSFDQLSTDGRTDGRVLKMRRPVGLPACLLAHHTLSSSVSSSLSVFHQRA